MAAAQERGLAVGRDVAITGFDDIPLAQYSHPPLTTVHQPIYQIGQMICDMLIKRIRGEDLLEPYVLLRPSLVVRRSTVGARSSGGAIGLEPEIPRKVCGKSQDSILAAKRTLRTELETNSSMPAGVGFLKMVGYKVAIVARDSAD
jgi:hypothetical protein